MQTPLIFFFFFNDTATPEIYPLSLHDALPIFEPQHVVQPSSLGFSITPQISAAASVPTIAIIGDRKSTRLNSSHLVISYAVFCLKKKNKLDLCPLHADPN